MSEIEMVDTPGMTPQRRAMIRAARSWQKGENTSRAYVEKLIKIMRGDKSLILATHAFCETLRDTDDDDLADVLKVSAPIFLLLHRAGAYYKIADKNKAIERVRLATDVLDRHYGDPAQ